LRFVLQDLEQLFAQRRHLHLGNAITAERQAELTIAEAGEAVGLRRGERGGLVDHMRIFH
jgi:hypothetical protein